MYGAPRLGSIRFLFSYLMWASLTLGVTTILQPSPVPAMSTATEAMKATISQALGILQDAELQKPERTDERVDRLRKIADVRFDYGEMAKRALGNQWGKLGEREREEFVGLFTEFLTATYVEKMNTYSGEEVRFLNERLEGDHAEVKTVMVGRKTDIPMDYRLMLKDAEWKAYDVVVDGISMVRSYREQFASVMRSSSYEHLVEMLREKVTQFNVKTKSGKNSASSR